MISLTVNGKALRAQEGEMLLAVLRREKIDIPALCHHEAVEPYGSCRLCMVEVTKKEWNGWKNKVTSCLYPVEEGLVVQTHTAEIIELRRTILDLYLARCPHAPEIQRLAAQYGISRSGYGQTAVSDDCILCGLCTRICEKMGFGAIAFARRGHHREVASPLLEAPPDCVGCLACAFICPTGHIKYRDDGIVREIWGRKFDLHKDAADGRPSITREFADYLSSHRNISRDYFTADDETRRRKTALLIGNIAAGSREVL